MWRVRCRRRGPLVSSSRIFEANGQRIQVPSRPASTHLPLRSVARWIPVVALALSGIPAPASAQIPTSRAEAMRMIQEDPEGVRARILASGLSDAEIRARLSAMGVDPTLLDAFMADAPVGTPVTVTDEALGALQMIGIVEETADGLQLVPLAEGMIPGRGLLSDSVPNIFGLDVFRRATSQFQPLTYGPVTDEYRLGPGDSMVLVLTGEVEQLYELVVSRAGFVVIPNVGRIAVANLSMGELRTILRDRLARAYSGIDRGSTSFDLTVTQLRTIQVHVAGEVEQAGAYQLASVATVMNALYAAGGPTELGNVRSVQVRRRTGGDVVVDLYPYLTLGEVAQDVGLEQGDVVFVPHAERRVHVTGAVRRPAYYDLTAEEDLLAALRVAGGFAPQAGRERLTIHRVVRPSERGPGATTRRAVDLALPPSEDAMSEWYLGGVEIPPVGLLDGDSIVVDSVATILESNHVIIAGMVAAPDTVPWHEGMTLRDLVLLARGPSIGADLREAEVTRLPSERSNGTLAERIRVPLDSSYLSQRSPDGRYIGAPGVTFDPPGTAPEFVLEPFDQVRILRQPDFQMPLSVMVTGEVPVPGEYTLLTKEDRISGLVERANGLLPTAYPEGARLYRSQNDLGRIDIDLPLAMANPDGNQDLILQPGDSLHIPVYSPTVVVQGAVNAPVAVLYREGEGFDYYISNAGGYRNDADKGRTSVRFANGQAQTRSKFLFWSSYPTPGPGSVINVPAKDPADRVDTRGLISDIVAILGSVTTVIVVVTR